jgi:tRNA (cytidine/uridine-2'-O-)-methyltransferase
LRIALYQPEIAQNTGTILRMSACMGASVDIIEPCGFLFNSPKFKRSAMDYLQQVNYKLHNCWENFFSLYKKQHRLILLTPHTDTDYWDFEFQADDILILGQESSGVPDEVMEQCDIKLRIPMKKGMRSLNVAVAGAMVLSEACRQLSKRP